MYCAYHPSNAARAQCGSCARPLCAGCDHRIKGYPYCQDCIILGIQSLSAHQQNRRSRSSARLAALFGVFLPGLGAIYNRQNVKAVVHFLTVACLFQLRHIGFFGGVFFSGGLAFYIYSIIDAYRTAQLITQGGDAAADEDQFKKRLARRAPVLGLGLVIGGALLAFQFLQPFGFPLTRLVPVALILLGGYLLTSHFKRTRDRDFGADHTDRSPHTLVRGPFAEQGSTGTQAPAWRQR